MWQADTGRQGASGFNHSAGPGGTYNRVAAHLAGAPVAADSRRVLVARHETGRARGLHVEVWVGVSTAVLAPAQHGAVADIHQDAAHSSRKQLRTRHTGLRGERTPSPQ